MPAFVYDRVCETTVTTGTGDITLAGAIVGHRTWNATVAINGTAYYLIEAVDGSGLPTGDWEVGVGKLTASTTLNRFAVIASSNANAVVTLAAGTKRVHVTASARQVAFSGILCQRSGDLTAQNFTTAAAVPFNQEAFSTEFTTPFHSTTVIPSQISVDGTRYGDSILRFSAQLSLTSVTSSDLIDAYIIDDLGSVIARQTLSAASTTPFINLASIPYQMSWTTRTFQLFLHTGSSTSITVKSGFGASWFSLEVLQ